MLCSFSTRYIQYMKKNFLNGSSCVMIWHFVCLKHPLLAIVVELNFSPLYVYLYSVYIVHIYTLLWFDKT